MSHVYLKWKKGKGEKNLRVMQNIFSIDDLLYQYKSDSIHIYYHYIHNTF